MLVVTHPAGSPKTALGPTALTARSGSVVHLDGCIQRQLFDHVNTATHRVLAGCGLEVKPWAAGCCGALHAHAGDLETARALARRNIEAFERAGADGIAVNAAGCGAALKAYGTWFEGDPAWAERAARFAAEVRDIAEVVTLPRVGEDPSPGTGARSSLRPDPGPGRGLGVRPDTDPGLRPDPGPDSRAAVHPEPHDRSGSRPLRVAWDPPCHQLHAQGIDAEARELLRGIPGVECVEVPRGSECCGGAGLYGITHPDLGDRITHDKLAAIESTGCDVVATSNPGCMMQIGAMAVERGIDLKVVHPIELVAWSLDHRIHSRGSA